MAAVAVKSLILAGSAESPFWGERQDSPIRVVSSPAVPLPWAAILLASWELGGGLSRVVPVVRFQLGARLHAVARRQRAPGPPVLAEARALADRAILLTMVALRGIPARAPLPVLRVWLERREQPPSAGVRAQRNWPVLRA